VGYDILSLNREEYAWFRKMFDEYLLFKYSFRNYCKFLYTYFKLHKLKEYIRFNIISNM